METVVNLKTQMEIESRVEVERRRKKEVAEFLPLKIVERRAIVAVLSLSRGYRPHAARLLGDSEATFYRGLKEYDQ